MAKRSTAQLLEEAQAAINRGDHAKATKLLRHAHKADASNEDVIRRLADSLVSSGKPAGLPEDTSESASLLMTSSFEASALWACLSSLVALAWSPRLIAACASSSSCAVDRLATRTPRRRPGT